MRVVRTILGIVLLTIGLPLLLIGGGLWTAMQHRDAGGAFSGALEEITNPGHAVVVPDVDGLLRREAPFARGDQTRLRITARTGTGPAFIGMAPAADATRYLAGVGHARVDTVKVSRSALPVRVAQVAGRATPAKPADQKFWVRSGTGTLEWSPSALRGQHLALVVMSADGQPAKRVAATAELRPGWLDSTAWGLLILGCVVVLLGIGLLAWPVRTREVVYVVDPSQVPEIAARLGVPVPSLAAPRAPDRTGAADHREGTAEPPPPGSRPGTLVPAARPATLAESTTIPSSPGGAGSLVPEPVAAGSASTAAGAPETGGGLRPGGAWPATAPPPALPNLAWPPLPAPPAELSSRNGGTIPPGATSTNTPTDTSTDASQIAETGPVAATGAPADTAAPDPERPDPERSDLERSDASGQAGTGADPTGTGAGDAVPPETVRTSRRRRNTGPPKRTTHAPPATAPPATAPHNGDPEVGDAASVAASTDVQPADTQPDATQSDATEPDATRPTDTQPGGGRSGESVVRNSAGARTSAGVQKGARRRISNSAGRTAAPPVTTALTPGGQDAEPAARRPGRPRVTAKSENDSVAQAG